MRRHPRDGPTTITLPEARVGEAHRHGALAVFPLFTNPDRCSSYRLAADALADGSAVVDEIDEEGSVPDLVVDNRGETQVLFLEGEELAGAKQDRVVNTSVLVPARGKVHIPVSCVEQGRWVYRSQRLMASGVHSPTVVRSALKSSVSRALEERQVAVANQAEIWDSVANLHRSYEVSSPTGALSAAYGQYAGRVNDYRKRLRYVPGARGLAVAVRERIVAIDLFDRTDTCRKVWDRLLSGAVFDAMAVENGKSGIGSWDVMCLLNTAACARWRPVRTVGDGTEYRAMVDGDPASMLCCDGVVVHQSIVAG